MLPSSVVFSSALRGLEPARKALFSCGSAPQKQKGETTLVLVRDPRRPRLGMPSFLSRRGCPLPALVVQRISLPQPPFRWASA